MVIRCFTWFLILSLIGCGSGKNTPSEDGDSGWQLERLTHKNTNIYLLRNAMGVMLIDAGYEASFEKIEDWLSDLNVGPDELKYLLLTHAHDDHVGAAHQLKSQFGLEVIAGRPDSAYYTNGLNVDLCPTSAFATMLSWFSKGRFQPVLPDRWVDRKDTLVIPDFGLKVFLLPGHTPGSLVALSDTQAFVGDLIRGRPLNNSRPTMHYFMCDEEDNIKDVNWLLDHSQSSIWHTGHFGPLETHDIRKWVGEK